MARHDWNERYESEDLPWDTGEPSAHLVDYFTRAAVPKPTRVLEVGCGTGTNALWLAAQGCTVLGLDIAGRAIAKAQAKAQATSSSARFAVADFLRDELGGEGPFEFVFDRGVLHVFDEASERERFAAHVAAHLVPGGHWLSLIGSTEGPARDHGPPRRSLRELADAIEPALEIVELRSIAFDTATPARAWWLLARKREVPAQPSTRL